MFPLVGWYSKSIQHVFFPSDVHDAPAQSISVDMIQVHLKSVNLYYNDFEFKHSDCWPSSLHEQFVLLHISCDMVVSSLCLISARVKWSYTFRVPWLPSVYTERVYTAGCVLVYISCRLGNLWRFEVQNRLGHSDKIHKDPWWGSAVLTVSGCSTKKCVCTYFRSYPPFYQRNNPCLYLGGLQIACTLHQLSNLCMYKVCSAQGHWELLGLGFHRTSSSLRWSPLCRCDWGVLASM